MKKLIFLVPSLLFLSYALQAADCVAGHMSDYDASGFSCSLNGVTFSNFVYTPVASGGAFAPPDSGVSVTPQFVGDEFGFLFTAAWLVNSKQTDDSFFTYTAKCDPACITDVALKFVGAAADGGAASVVETTSNGVNLFATPGNPAPPPATFSPIGSIDLSKDIGMSGGEDGAAHISAVYNFFSKTTTVPEPSLVLLCTALFAMIAVGGRMARRRLS
jgi:hypothetical protein